MLNDLNMFRAYFCANLIERRFRFCCDVSLHRKKFAVSPNRDGSFRSTELRFIETEMRLGYN